MIINYSILLTFDGISHVSAFDLEAMCAWHMKHILRMWFITELFFLVSEKIAAQEGHSVTGTAIFVVGVWLWLQRGNLNSEKSEISVFSNLRNPFVCSSKLGNVAKHFPLFFFLIFLGKDEQSITGYENHFPRLVGVSPDETCSCNSRTRPFGKLLIARVSVATLLG